MRKRSALAALATAAILSTSAITPASAYTKVYTDIRTYEGSDTEYKSCAFYSDENLNALERFQQLFVPVEAALIDQVRKLDFFEELNEWHHKAPDDRNGETMPEELKKKILAAGFKESDFQQLIFATSDEDYFNKIIEGNLFGRYLPYSEDENAVFTFAGTTAPADTTILHSKDTFSDIQEKVKTLNFDSLEAFVASTGAVQDNDANDNDKDSDKDKDKDNTQPDVPEQSKGMQELYTKAFNQVKTTLSKLRDDVVNSTYDEYAASVKARKAQILKADEGCRNWIDGKAEKEDIPFYAGSYEDFKPERTVDENLKFVFGNYPSTTTPGTGDTTTPGTGDTTTPGTGDTTTPGTGDTTDQKKPAKTNSGSGSTGGILVVVLAIAAILGGIGAWLGGLIPGLPKPPMGR